MLQYIYSILINSMELDGSYNVGRTLASLFNTILNPFIHPLSNVCPSAFVLSVAKRRKKYLTNIFLFVLEDMSEL